MVSSGGVVLRMWLIEGLGRTLGVFPSGVYDMLEDHEAGYGGIKWATMLDYEGYTDLV